ncbi:MAG: alpha/beta fold hydrolase [Thermoanaerobaculia bacterium]
MLLRLYSHWTRVWLRGVGARRRRVDAGRYRMAVYELGPREAPPWLLLHGLGATAASWMALLRRFRRCRRLIVPELSALGGTSGPLPAVQVAEAADVLAALLPALDLRPPVTVLGMSLGGWMAARLALDRPKLVERLVLIDSAGWHDQDWDHVRTLVTLRTRDDVDRLYRAIFLRPPVVLRWSRGAFLDAYRSPAVRSILERTREEDTFTRGDLASLAVPTGLVWGEHDGLFPATHAHQMAAALPLAHLEIVPGCSHGLHWECPCRFAAAVERAAGFQPG